MVALRGEECDDVPGLVSAGSYSRHSYSNPLHLADHLRTFELESG